MVQRQRAEVSGRRLFDLKHWQSHLSCYRSDIFVVTSRSDIRLSTTARLSRAQPAVRHRLPDSLFVASISESETQQFRRFSELASTRVNDICATMTINGLSDELVADYRKCFGSAYEA